MPSTTKSLTQKIASKAEMQPYRILPFWFDGYTRGTIPPLSVRIKWYTPPPIIDEYIVRHFSEDLEQYRNEKLNKEDGPYTKLEQDALGSLSLILLGTFVSRSILRQNVQKNGELTPDLILSSWCSPSGQLFEDCVREVSYISMHRLFPLQFDHVERAFYYYPILCRETKLSQAVGLKRLSELYDESPRNLRPYIEILLKYSQENLNVITQFGRFPTRNQLLGRESTEEEQEYLRSLVQHDKMNAIPKDTYTLISTTVS